MIRPTVGRIVWFWYNFEARKKFKESGQSQPLAAMVTFVHNDRLVNLMVHTKEGASVGAQNVPFFQPEDEPEGEIGKFCEWMPCQKTKDYAAGAQNVPILQPGGEKRGDDR